MKRFLPSIALLLLLPHYMQAQVESQTVPADEYVMTPRHYNFDSFSSEVAVADLQEVTDATDPKYHNHPEFGTVPYRTQCKDCYEVLDKRTADSRYFVKNGTDGSTFYVQQIYGQLHYLDGFGNWRTIDERLRPYGQANVYAAPYQVVPTEYNHNTGHSAIRAGMASLRYNGNTRLYLDDGVSLTDMGELNKSQTTVGDDGVLTRGAWNKIDRVQYFRQGAIKTNFVVHESLNLPSKAKWLVIEDRFELPTGFDLVRDQSSGSASPEGYWMGDLVVRDQQGDEAFRLRRPALTDANPDKYGRLNALSDPSATYIAYDESVEGGTVTLRLRVQAEWMEQPERVFPITIDPLVTGSATFSAGIMGFRYDATCWNATNFCGYNLNVNVPGNSTITNAFMDAQYESEVWGCGIFVDCWMSEAAFRVVGPCGNSPVSPFFWTCLSPTGDAAGTCSGVGNPALETVDCVPPQCANYNLTFQMRNYYCFCSSGGCPISCQSMPNNSWTMTVEARTIESSAQANSTPIIYNGSCGVPTTIDANPAFGVPGYTYNWSGGPSTSSQSQAVTHTSNGTYSYSVTVTDACGQTSVSNVDIVIADCPLPLEMSHFSGEAATTANLLYWETASESNLETYRVERSENGEDFVALGDVEAKNLPSTYHFEDHSPPSGPAFYRLRIVDQEGGENLSEQVELRRDAEDLLAVRHDPAKGSLEVQWVTAQSGIANLELYSLGGQMVYREQVQVTAGVRNVKEMDLADIAAGVYLVRLNGISRRVVIGK